MSDIFFFKVFLFLWTFHSDNAFLYYLSFSFILFVFFCLENICMNISVSLLLFFVVVVVSLLRFALFYSISHCLFCVLLFLFFLLKISIIKFISKILLAEQMSIKIRKKIFIYLFMFFFSSLLHNQILWRWKI